MRGLAVLAALAMALSTTSVASAATDPTPAPYLPAPTGSAPVGSTSLYLKDTSRPDPWVSSVPYRELMVSLYYPAASSHGPKAQYMTPEESAALLDGSGTGLPPETLARTRTNSVQNARPVGRRHSLPLVVLSPGYSNPRGTLTALAEDLASHGYVVALVGDTYEDSGTSFPDGHFTTCATCDLTHDDAFWAKVGDTRATDVSFVLDRLTGRHPAWRGSDLIDPSRIGMAGHSAGGASSIPAMVADPRIRAGVDVDGVTTNPVPVSGLSRPVLFISHARGGTACLPVPSWDKDWPQLTGWKRWLEVAGTVHASFTDVGLFSDQYGLDIGATTSGTRTQAVTRTYVEAFFNQTLRGQHQPLLAKPSTHYPEVAYCR
ncbi:alpha/beta hydrolase family protein [Kribbella kalugense]|uniref:Platelet-activating factor acetylhydrolase isoform II n=1 Tax=Kribbella kalugense TaxID=2512221 RepID=A0A4R7ZMP3_9ACTN|nr:alpha/beta hydrolase [Kribbella kalugense]TDW18556.1 platelet-activating factor acetylhydrolase isoform II [Kribbella kalugense]